jgi:thioredoxin-dependent peroxiredoxin
MFRTGKMVAGVAAGLMGFAAVAMLAPKKAMAAGDMASVGAAAPNFSLPAQDNKPVSLSDYKGKWVVLYFYPKDQTKGCSIEAHNFQRDQDKYKALNAVVLGVSLDTVESHATWCTKDSFTFKMLADPQHKVVDLYGVPLMTQGDASYAQRDTFLISPSGKIVKTWQVKDVQAHSDDVLGAIASMK